MSGKKHHSCSCCGWSNLTTYRGLRIHQGKMGCTPKGLRIPESAQSNYYPRLTYTPTPIKIEDPYYEITKAPVRPVFEMPPPSYKSLRSLDQRLSTGPSQVGRIMNSTIQMTPPSTQTPMKETNNSLFGNFPVSFRTVTSSHQALPVLDFSTGTLQADVTLSVMSTIQMSSPSTPTQMLETNKSYFQTPPLSYQAYKSSDTARRVLDFSTVQVGQLREHLPAAGEETIMDLKKKEKEKAREAEKLLQEKHDRMRADLQQKISTRERKIAEVSSSAKTCMKSLDSEKLEIDAVFSEVMTIVQDAWEEALLPLEKRKKTLKREAQSLVQRLQTEVDRLKDTIDELERDRDAQVFPLQGLDESGWGKSVDTSCSFGTLRATTSTMMKEIQQKLEDLSPLELKRIPAFAVDIKLDSATAHQSLILSDDGKKVRDSGKKLKVVDDAERFDMFGSVLGLNRFSAGRSYWEVEVSNKTGWDLGVARRRANRKGLLTVDTENGYWVTVHYEGNRYAALTAPPVSLALKARPQKVGVFVDYEEGLVSFYDVTTRSHIYSFTECSFDGDIVPYFSPHLAQNDKNTDPLIISAVQKQ